MKGIKYTLWAATLFILAWTLRLVSAVVGSKFIKPGSSATAAPDVAGWYDSGAGEAVL